MASELVTHHLRDPALSEIDDVDSILGVEPVFSVSHFALTLSCLPLTPRSIPTTSPNIHLRAMSDISEMSDITNEVTDPSRVPVNAEPPSIRMADMNASLRRLPDRITNDRVRRSHHPVADSRQVTKQFDDLNTVPQQSVFNRRRTMEYPHYERIRTEPTLGETHDEKHGFKRFLAILKYLCSRS